MAQEICHLVGSCLTFMYAQATQAAFEISAMDANLWATFQVGGAFLASVCPRCQFSSGDQLMWCRFGVPGLGDVVIVGEPTLLDSVVGRHGEQHFVWPLHSILCCQC